MLSNFKFSSNFGLFLFTVWQRSGGFGSKISQAYTFTFMKISIYVKMFYTTCLIRWIIFFTDFFRKFDTFQSFKRKLNYIEKMYLAWKVLHNFNFRSTAVWIQGGKNKSKRVQTSFFTLGAWCKSLLIHSKGLFAVFHNKRSL